MPRKNLAALATDTGPIRWQDRPYQPLDIAAKITGLSVSKLYGLNTDGVLDFVRLGGRTMATTPSLLKLLSSATPWQRSAQADAALAGRRSRFQRNDAA